MADRRRRRLALAAASAAGVLAMGGLAVAAHTTRTIPIGPDGTITACAKEGSGKLRMVAAATACGKHEQVVTWNQKGPKGDQGPQGPQGPPGAAAPDPGDVVIGTMTIDTNDAVDIHAFSFDVSNSITLGTGSGAGVGKAKAADIEVLKDIDAQTASILADLVGGERVPKVTVVLYDPGATTTRARFTFSNVFFTASGQTGGDDLEQVKFLYEKVEEQIGPAIFRWDLKAGKVG
jgi:type VI protein secretion system component Hcp